MPEEAFLILPAVLFLMIPIIAILTAHQRRMAEVLNARSGNGAEDARILKMEAELAAMREQMAHQTLVLDSIHRSQRALESQIVSGGVNTGASVRERLEI